ncbi:TPA: hypothetical protein HA265_04070 [Candidatus Woesearchaeota archaeon]|nr:hypothetical protein [Candidatus Woesearchaeota archaeon]
MGDYIISKGSEILAEREALIDLLAQCLPWNDRSALKVLDYLHISHELGGSFTPEETLETFLSTRGLPEARVANFNPKSLALLRLAGDREYFRRMDTVYHEVRKFMDRRL